MKAKNGRKRLEKYLSVQQYKALSRLCKGEEREYFAEMLDELATRVETMPKIYEQDGKGDDAIVYLHYFTGGYDWYITEISGDEGFGLCCIFERELGYVSIPELTKVGAELDLHWTPKRLGDVKPCAV